MIEDSKYFTTIMATFFATILSTCVPNTLLQILFIILFMLGCFFNISFLRNRKKWKGFIILFACIIDILLFIFSVINSGSVIGCWGKIKNFFGETKSESITNSDLKDYYEDLNEKILELNNNIEMINNNISTINNEQENINESEVDEIIEKIKMYQEEKPYTFSDIKTDLYSLELFYKMRFSNEIYYYTNIINAFEKYGINIEGCNESTLITWDIEMLFATINMRNINIENMNSDEIIENIIFYYNDNKVSMERYSDDFDYSDWNREFNGLTGKEIDEKLNDIIIWYYKKLIKNFSEK